MHWRLGCPRERGRAGARPRRLRAMKSAGGRDRTGLPGGTATSRSGWRRRGYTTGREGHRHRPTTFRLRFPEGPRVRAAERARDAARSRQTRWSALGHGAGAPQPIPPKDQLRPGINLPTLEESSSAFRGASRRSPSTAPVHALSLSGPWARVGPPTRALGMGLLRAVRAAQGPFPRPASAPSAGGRRERRAPGEGGRSLGTGASRPSAGRRGACPCPALPAARRRCPGARWRLRGWRSSPGPGSLSQCPAAAAPGVGGEGKGCALGQGLAAGERLARERSQALPPAIWAK